MLLEVARRRLQIHCATNIRRNHSLADRSVGLVHQPACNPVIWSHFRQRRQTLTPPTANHSSEAHGQPPQRGREAVEAG